MVREVTGPEGESHVESDSSTPSEEDSEQEEGPIYSSNDGSEESCR